MKRRSFRFYSVWLSATMALACASTLKDSDLDTETNWFGTCSDDRDCHDTSCLCGICTIACTADTECGSAPSGSTCRATEVAGLCSSGTAPGSDQGICAIVSIENPTGSCTAPDDGSRPGYHSPAGHVWLPDCESPLPLEYWRVFAQSPESAYIVPRPDGTIFLGEPCYNFDHELRELVERYRLCDAARSSADVDVINDMAPADALKVAHYLHTLLAFRPTDDGILPPPLPSDVLSACALRPDERSAALVSICEAEEERLQGGGDIGIDYAPAATELAARLNEVYGITCDSGDVPVHVCECGPADQCVDARRECRTPCTSDDECEAFTWCAWGACVPGPCG
jgi:hypothetical protein